MTRIVVVALALALTPASLTHAQQAMRVATSPPGPGLQVVLTWPTDPSAARFNLYRRVQGQPVYPPAPLNPVPIARLTACAMIQAVVPVGSDDWESLKNGLADDPTTPFDPCAIATIPPGSAKDAKLQFLARSRWPIAVVAGQGYRDLAVVSGTTYEYQLRGVNAVGAETGALLPDVTVTAGAPALLPAPGGVTATAGDSRVLVLWGSGPAAAGFAVFRATAAAGPYQRVNEASVLVRVTQDLDGTPIAASNGFLDIRRWDPSGNPDTHLVQGVAVDGPANGVTYFYRVASLDLLGQPGPTSAPPASATPEDRTAPAAPAGMSVTAVDSEHRLEVRWNVVEHDVEGHVESAAMAGYRVFRYESENAPPGSGVQVGGLIPSPPPGQGFVLTSDNAPLLRPPFGEKTYWYRVEAVDVAGNVSARSAALGGHLADITPPAPPKGVTAEGFDEFIRVRWVPNTEPDLDGYQIYRSLCHKGVCTPCEPDRRRQPPAPSHDVHVAPVQGGQGDVCGGPYALVGTVSRTDAEGMGSPVTFDDRTVPAGSPLCYSYWVKALDRTQNRSGAWPVPDPLTETTVCQRLRDKTPPDPAIISGLFARDRAIRVEWVGPPVQDIRAYHVYRSTTQNGMYAWVGGMTVEPPPLAPHVLTSPYMPPSQVDCATIPLVTIESMSTGLFVDTHVDPKETYWYKVVGIDQNGNEAPLDRAAPISTFTFTTATPAAPVITSISATTASPFALVLRWAPAFDPSTQRGFAVFRSDRPDGLYRQIGTLLDEAEYRDTHVVRGVTYWYRVLQMDRSGQVSVLSPPASASLPPTP
jgi:hypothetical protein